MNNTDISRKLIEHARILETNGHNLYRVRAYRRAASLVQMLPCEVDEVVRHGGCAALESIPGIGSHLAFTLERLVTAGELKTMGPAPEQTDPSERLTSFPGVGPKLALRMEEELGIETVEEAVSAAEDGRLAEVGIGRRR